MTPEQQKVLSRLERLCSKAEYCRADACRKALKALEGDEAAATEVADILVQERYVDDVRYATAFAREKAHIQGWGPVKIRFQLRGKGVGEEAVREALQEIEEPRAQDKLDRLLAAKAKTLEGDAQQRLKLLKFGLSRGYDYPAVEASLERLKNNS